jgi:hypothetical protein
MTTTINADTVVGGAVVTADASGQLGLQAAGNTGITLNSSRAIGVGASPSFGTSGQVLTSAGSAAAPTWTTLGATGSMVFLESVTAASSASVELTALTSTYAMYMIVGTAIKTATNNESLRLRVAIGATVQTTGYRGNIAYMQSGSSGSIGNEGADTAYLLINRGQTSSSATDMCSFVLYIGAPSDATFYKAIAFQTFGTTNSPVSNYQFGGGAYMGGTGAISKLNFAATAGNLASGTFRLYGIKNS